MNKKSLGIIGGGQLGSLLAQAAKKIDISPVILTDDVDAPAKFFSDKFFYGSYKDKKIVKQFCESVDIVTFEFENIPFEILNNINQSKKVYPKPEINLLIQNRSKEKKFLNDIGLETTKYVNVKSINDIKQNSSLLPGILKTCTLGYDGKGQHVINNREELIKLNIKFDKDYILEKKVSLKKEVSVIITRFGKKSYEIYEPIENKHSKQILRESIIPAKIELSNYKKAIDWAKKISEKLDFIGTLCVEYFLDTDDNLYVNEIAPRVHNSGHLTINTHNVSQFENHVRAVCGLEKIKLKKLKNAKMINLIGKDILVYRSKILKKNEFFFDYLKKEVKEKRKMGHITILKD